MWVYETDFIECGRDSNSGPSGWKGETLLLHHGGSSFDLNYIFFDNTLNINS